MAPAAADSTTTRPSLAYSLPAFRPDGYRPAPQWLGTLRELGFRSVVLHPTYAVFEDLRIDVLAAPSIADAVGAARTLGMAVRLEPHLDWWPTLHGGSYEWRRSMRVDPQGEYFDVVLGPAAALAPDELTIGSELDLSAYEFTSQWEATAERLRGGLSRIGHKVNHDVFASEWRPDKKRRLRRYLDNLDFKAMSFYPAGEWTLPEGWTIGEFGLGSTDITRPWHFDASTFQTAEDFSIRQDWYLRFFEWLPVSGAIGAAAFWTAGHFDVLGVMHPEWRDDAVLEAVRAYNYASP